MDNTGTGMFLSGVTDLPMILKSRLLICIYLYWSNLVNITSHTGLIMPSVNKIVTLALFKISNLSWTQKAKYDVLANMSLVMI